MKIEEIINNLDPVTLLKFKEYLTNHLIDYCTKKNSNAKIISTYSNKILFCEKCGLKLAKNGKTKNGIQKYICTFCKKTSSQTTNTTIYHSKLSFEIWANVINNLIDGFSIRRIAKQNKISIKTSFYMRHKILKALNNFIESIKLLGNVQADEKYFSINLKGTKPNNMPRFSKKRGSASSLAGLSHHKICVVSAIDNNNNLVLKIAGLSKCTSDMLEKVLGSKIKKATSLNADSASSYDSFCFKHHIHLNKIPSGCHSMGLININKINSIHSQLETWLSKFRGVSIRHLQDYLNWFNYIFIMMKKFDIANIKFESYSNIIIDDNYIKTKEILKLDYPIDLSSAYSEFSHQS